MRLRQYIISSSPLATPGRCTLTVDTRSPGVASSYLARLQPGDRTLVSVRESHPSFHLPWDAESTPVIMVAAGTGIAPFRGFVQERHTMLTEGGRSLAPALLFYGCRTAKDVPFAAELAAWAASGAVQRLCYAFSEESRSSGGCRYVQDRFWAERDEVVVLLRRGARMYVCGHGRVGDGLMWKAIDASREVKARRTTEVTNEDVERWFGDLRDERHMEDDSE